MQGIRTAWVSGASSGFGAAIAKRLLAEGWRVVASGRRAERLAALADGLDAERLHRAAFDIRDRAATARAVAAVPAAFQDIDLLVSNAGLALGTGTVPDVDAAQWQQMIDTNISGLVELTRLLLPGLIERRGAIIQIGSISATYAYSGGNVYGATKAFVQQFGAGLRVDLHGSGVRVTTLEPGMAETEFTLVRTGGDQKASDKLYAGSQPITAEDIAETVSWVANLPPHLNVNRLELMPVSQSPAGLRVHREP